MRELLDFTIFTFSSLFVIVDPIGLIPAFLAMTSSNSTHERIRMAAVASLTTFLILNACAVGGLWIFSLFGITMPAFEIAGGVVLLLIGLDMLQARRTAVKETKAEQREGMEKDDVAVAPIAVPMLAGPGAITTVIILSHRAGDAAHKFVLAANIAVVCVLTFIILWWVSLKSAGISGIAMRIVSRLMGLLLTAIAVQFILNGVAHSNVFRLVAQ